MMPVFTYECIRHVDDSSAIMLLLYAAWKVAEKLNICIGSTRAMVYYRICTRMLSVVLTTRFAIFSSLVLFFSFKQNVLRSRISVNFYLTHHDKEYGFHSLSSANVSLYSLLSNHSLGNVSSSVDHLTKLAKNNVPAQPGRRWYRRSDNLLILLGCSARVHTLCGAPNFLAVLSIRYSQSFWPT